MYSLRTGVRIVGRVPDRHRCTLCGRTGMGGNIVDGRATICTEGPYSCRGFQLTPNDDGIARCDNAVQVISNALQKVLCHKLLRADVGRIVAECLMMVDVEIFRTFEIGGCEYTRCLLCWKVATQEHLSTRKHAHRVQHLEAYLINNGEITKWEESVVGRWCKWLHGPRVWRLPTVDACLLRSVERTFVGAMLHSLALTDIEKHRSPEYCEE
jgi:hypothetical protein